MNTMTIRERIESLANAYPFLNRVADTCINTCDMDIIACISVWRLLTDELEKAKTEYPDEIRRYEIPIQGSDGVTHMFYSIDESAFTELYALKYIQGMLDSGRVSFGSKVADAIVHSINTSYHFDNSGDYSIDSINDHIEMMVEFLNRVYE